jgi:nucleoside-diphosphate-sugar epimerase
MPGMNAPLLTRAPPGPLPESLSTDAEIDALMARPYGELVDLMRRLPGDLAILGVAGKMGLALGAAAVAATRAAGIERQVYGVSRFSISESFDAVGRTGMTPIRCDLLDARAVADLPRAPNVIFMAGRKFGTVGEEEQTWAANVLAPVRVCEHFAGSRIVAFSTGCVYPLAPTSSGGCTEATPPDPTGEYAQSCLGRERLFGFYSRRNGTPVCLLRLNYALDLRYGVIHDIAAAIWQGCPVSRRVPFFNGIWQGDANNLALLALDAATSPAAVLNVTGPEKLSVTKVAETLGRRLGKPVAFDGEPGSAAYLNDASRLLARYGGPRVPVARVIEWTADWIRAGGRSFGKPTHFEVANGSY